MDYFKVTEYGICDTHIRFPDIEITKDRHVHKFEFELLISGDGTSYINNDSCVIEPGLVLFRKPGDVSHSKLHFKALYFYLTIDEDCKYYAKAMQFSSYHFSASRDEYYSVFENLFKLFSMYGTAENNDLINAEILRLLFFLERDTKRNIKPQHKSKTYASILPSVDFINKHFTEEITLVDIAKASGYSQFYFQKKFVETMGVSPLTFLTETRITHAKQLLIDPQKSLIDIAYECGFPSQSYFCYLFKKHTGLTPTEYRKGMTENYLL